MLAPAVGSGKPGTPCARTHWAKATSEGLDGPAVEALADVPAFGEPAELVPPQAAASMATAAMAVSAWIRLMLAGLRAGW